MTQTIYFADKRQMFAMYVYHQIIAIMCLSNSKIDQKQIV